MADTIRDRAALLTLLADNATGNISAQDMRDLLVSLFGAYGSIFVEGGVTAQSVGTNPAQLTAFATNGPASGFLVDHTADQIVVPADGIYDISACFSFTGDSTVALYGFELRNNGLQVAGGLRTTTKVATTEVRSCSFSGLLECDANDILTVYADADATRNLTVNHATLAARLIG